MVVEQWLMSGILWLVFQCWQMFCFGLADAISDVCYVRSEGQGTNNHVHLMRVQAQL